LSSTLIRIFYDALETYRKPAMFMRRTPAGWESIPSDRACADVESFGLALRDLGIQAGDRVAILSESRYEWPLADLAILGLGAVTVPIYPTLTATQVRFILENSEARLAIASTPAQQEKVIAAMSAQPRLERMIAIEPAQKADPRVVDFATLLEGGRAARVREPHAFPDAAAKIVPSDLATIIYTSGTTGEPKGAMLTHGNIASNVESCLQVVDLNPADTMLSFLPLCHIFERMGGLYAMLARGVTIAYAENFERVAANAVEVRPTVLTGVPRFYEKVHSRVMDAAARMPRFRRRIFDWGIAKGVEKARAHFKGRERDSLAMRLADRLVWSKLRDRLGGRVRFCISGGAPLAPQVMEFFFAIGVPVLEGYGLTETSPVICLNVPGEEKPGTVGPPVPGVEVRIGEDGEILTRGPHVMKGYFKNEEATRLALRDGWFHTGDIGRIDPDGNLVITDRLKDLLVTAGGKKVAPQPIEALLKKSRWVSEAVLLGDRKPYVVCLIAPNFAQLEAEAESHGWRSSSRAELVERAEVQALYRREIETVNRDLAPFEQIKKFAVLENEMSQSTGELTPTLKVRRRVVAEKYASLIEGLYANRALASV